MLLTLPAPTRADTLVTTAGTVIHGTVRPIVDAYTVHTDDGQTTTVAAGDVRQLTFDRPAGPTTRPRVPGKAAYVAGLIDDGRVAMAGNDLEVARKAFATAVTADPTNPTANRGLGFALLKLNDDAHAVQPLTVAARATPDRSLALGLAASLVATSNPVRAIKVLSTYLNAHAAPPDEPMVNALGIALSRVDGSAVNGEAFHDGQSLYAKLNAALEVTRPGERRWGTQWEPTATVTRQTNAWHVAQRQVADDAAHVAQLDHDRLAALNRSQSRNALGYTNYWAQQNEARFDARTADNLAGQEAAAQTRLDQAKQALATTDAPPFPPAIPIEDLDLTLAPAGTGK
jgi:hypothetical protein